MTVLAHEWTIPGNSVIGGEMVARARTADLIEVGIGNNGYNVVMLDLEGALALRDALDDLITNHLQHKGEGQ